MGNRYCPNSKGFDRNPHNMGADSWFYEGPGGLEVYYRTKPGAEGDLVGVIRRTSIRAYLSRRPPGSRPLDWRAPRRFKDGEPCKHPGCLFHRSHPCEGCGRIGGYPVAASGPRKARR